MDPPILLEARIVNTPEPIDAICFLCHGFYHLGFVFRQIVGDVKKDITDQIAYGGNRLGGDIFEGKLILARVLVFAIWVKLRSPVINVDFRSPINLRAFG